MKYVIQTDNGFFRHVESPRNVTMEIVTDLQQATVFDFGDVPLEQLQNDFDVKWMFDKALNAGGHNPKLTPVSLSLTIPNE